MTTGQAITCSVQPCGCLGRFESTGETRKAIETGQDGVSAAMSLECVVPFLAQSAELVRGPADEGMLDLAARSGS